MRCSVRRVFCRLLLLACLLIVEEIHSGSLFISLMNVYTQEFTLPITGFRNENRVDVAVVVVVEGSSHKEQYALAQASLSCYCQLHGYPLYVLDLTKDPSLKGGCLQKDLMFLRHCVLANTMPRWPHSWVLFVDGDMGVINPNHLIEKYLPSDPFVSLVFYQRVFNHEIMAGSYLARNNEFSRVFLHSWAKYEFLVPDSFHGTDNGAIHSVVADLVPSADQRHRDLCQRYWNQSRDYESLSLHEVCLQLFLRKHPPTGVSLLRKGRLAWARDGWLTNSVWSSKDFIFHGWQQRRQDKLIFGRWHSPLVQSSFEEGDCSSPEKAAQKWRYKNTFYSSDVAVDRVIMGHVEEADSQFYALEQTIERDLATLDL